MLRVASAIVLAPVAIVVAYLGGWPFAVFWSLAAAIVLWEWTAIVMAVPAAHERIAWISAGAIYAGLLMTAPIVLRTSLEFGFAAIVFLFAVVWATDIAGYFAGRIIGGPKLAPSISPKKTWAGAAGGTVTAVALSVVLARWHGGFDLFAIAGIALLLSVIAQIGDLLESALKRRFGTKDASQLIPGHGGVMDRLDGFWAAALVAAIIGICRGGFADAARGLLLW